MASVVQVRKHLADFGLTCKNHKRLQAGEKVLGFQIGGGGQHASVEVRKQNPRNSIHYHSSKYFLYYAESLWIIF